MSRFKECVDAIRHNGLNDAAEIVGRLASRRPKLFAAVAIGQTNYGEECYGFNSDQPRVFLTKESAGEEAERLTRDFWRKTPLSEVLERFEMEEHAVDAGTISDELTRILGTPTQFPGPDVEYWHDERCKRPLLPADTSDEQASEVAKLLGLELFKVVPVPCDVNMAATSDPSPHRSAADGSGTSTTASTGRGILSRLNWRRR